MAKMSCYLDIQTQKALKYQQFGKIFLYSKFTSKLLFCMYIKNGYFLEAKCTNKIYP